MLGLIGCGQIFHDCYLTAFDYLNVGDLIVFDESGDSMARALNAAISCKGINMFAANDLQSVVTGSDKIIVLVPPAHLLSVVQRLSILNIHKLTILVEKPMGVSAAEAKSIIEICESPNHHFKWWYEGLAPYKGAF